MLYQPQLPAGAGIMFLLPFPLIIGLIITLIDFIRKNKHLKKQLAMLQEYRKYWRIEVK